jgi:hypothetical protein
MSDRSLRIRDKEVNVSALAHFSLLLKEAFNIKIRNPL